MNLLTKQKETHRLRKQFNGCQGEEIVRDFEKVIYTLLYLKWITNKHILYSTQNSAQYYMPDWITAISSVQSVSRVRLFATPCIAARQASLSITNSRSPPKPMSIELVMPSNHLFLCRPLLLLPSIFPSIRVLTMSQFFA